jgi:hypothetical protein
MTGFAVPLTHGVPELFVMWRVSLTVQGLFATRPLFLKSRGVPADEFAGVNAE